MSLEIKNLSFSYYKKEVLNNINLNFTKNGLYSLLGKNGSGKSTLFKCIMNFLKVKNGEIFINSKLSLNKHPSWMAKNISYVPQQSSDTFGFSVLEIVLMGKALELKGGFIHKKDDIKKAHSILEKLNILKFKNARVMDLSGGERQLVYIARAILQNASIMLLDEPTSALDFKNQILFWQIVKEISKEKIVIVCTHEPNHAYWFSDVMLGLKDTKLKFMIDSNLINDELISELYDKKCQIYKDEKFIKPLI